MIKRSPCKREPASGRSKLPDGIPKGGLPGLVWEFRGRYSKSMSLTLLGKSIICAIWMLIGENAKIECSPGVERDFPRTIFLKTHSFTAYSDKEAF